MSGDHQQGKQPDQSHFRTQSFVFCFLWTALGLVELAAFFAFHEGAFGFFNLAIALFSLWQAAQNAVVIRRLPQFLPSPADTPAVQDRQHPPRRGIQAQRIIHCLLLTGIGVAAIADFYAMHFNGLGLIVLSFGLFFLFQAYCAALVIRDSSRSARPPADEP